MEMAGVTINHYYSRLPALALLLLGVLLFLPACSPNPPAPVEDYSSFPDKRRLNADGSYFVRSGDTLYAIAFNYGMDPQDVAKWNAISSPYVIYPGQKLRLIPPPAGSSPVKSSSAVTISKAKAPSSVTTKTVEPKTSPAASTPSPANKVASKPVAKPPAKPVPTSQSDPESWKWPTEGRVLRTYIAGDPARNGLDIAGKEGQAIKAAAAGVVVYSGNGLIGYGELIIIKHSQKMLSAYAHNKVRLVKEGEQVSSGQKIAEMGRNAGNEQILHFEIRAKGKPVNPLVYLPKK